MYNTETFVRKAREKWNFDIDYSKVKYVNSKTKISLICNIHGKEFEVLPGKHLSRGDGCPVCRYEKTAKNNPNRKKLEEFVAKANEVHDNCYDYSQAEYKNARTKVRIVCPEHGVFYQEPRHHLSGHGCPCCCKSRGEQKVAKWLKDNGYDFVREFYFVDLYDDRTLRYDFYIYSERLLIEYEGEQHYSYCFNDTRESFLKRQHHTWMKRDYAKKHGYNYLRVPFNKDVGEVLEKYFTKSRK